MANNTFDAVEFMKALVTISGDRWVLASRFLELPDRFGVTTPTGRIELIGKALNLLRDMPVKIFPDEETRWAVLAAGQEALDEVIDLEEEQLAADFESDDNESGRHT